MANLEFMLVVIEDGIEVLAEPLSCELMGNITNSYPDKASSTKFFSYASMHPSVEVRQNIAYKDKLGEDACRLLSEDNSVNVLRNLVSNTAFREIATFEVLEKLIGKDAELAQLIARNLEVFKNVDIHSLAEMIAANSDPSVLLALAQNGRAPKKILRTLSLHRDRSISEAAHESLK
jgi:hypothetical protein